MTGVVSTPIFVQDGMYLSFVVSSAAVNLGDFLMLNNDGTVSGITTSSTSPIGVAVSGNRISRTSTDAQIAVGDYVTVVTRGVVNLTVGTGSVAPQQVVEGYTTGQIQTHTPGSAAYPAMIGRVLVGASATAQATVLLNL